VECVKHPDSEKLYCEKIDLGNGEIRDITSGLVHFYSLEQMIGAMVVVICNLKPRAIAGNMSAGMVMCAQTTDGKVVEFLAPPEGSAPGDEVSFEGFERKPPAELPGKRWAACVDRFIIDEN
jgi:methionine--tRNA ligase beta chain